MICKYCNKEMKKDDVNFRFKGIGYAVVVQVVLKK